MFKLLDLFKYSDTKFFKDFEKKTCNQIVSYDVEFNLRLEYFYSYFYKRVYSSIKNSDYYKDREIKTALNLSYMTTSDFTKTITDYLSRSTITIITGLTQYSNHTDYYEFLGTDDIELSDSILDIVRSINCHHRIRRIGSSNSVLKCKKLVVNNDLSDKDNLSINSIYFDLLKYNKIISLLKLDETSIVTNYAELYYSNDYDTSINLVDKDGTNITALLGENNQDADIIVGLLTQPNYTNTDNFSLRTSEFNVLKKECLDILKYGEVYPDKLQNTNDMVNENTLIETRSKFGTLSNTSIVLSTSEKYSNNSFKTTNVPRLIKSTTTLNKRRGKTFDNISKSINDDDDYKQWKAMKDKDGEEGESKIPA